jgi:sugar lactone lactonase YvrE
MHRDFRCAGLALFGLLAGLSDWAFSQTRQGCKGGSEVRTLSASYPEGPCFLGDRFYYVEYGANRVNGWDGVRRWKLWEQAKSGPSGLLPRPDGTLLVACYDKNTLVRINEEGKTLETIRLDADAKGPNDLTADARGGVYFSTSGIFEKGAPVEGKVYYLPAAGKPRLVAGDIHYANGLAVTDGGKCLLVAEHLKGRILKFLIGKDGGLSGRAVWKRLADVYPDPDDVDWYTGPDGLKVDSQGNLYVCQFGASRILVTRPDGTCFRTVTLPEKYVTNVALGRNEDFLYVTAVKDPWKEPYPGTVYEIPNR